MGADPSRARDGGTHLSARLIDLLLQAVHIGALVLWALALVVSQARILRAGDPDGELLARRSARVLVALEHALFVLALAAGLLLMLSRGWTLAHARWLGLKVGLVVFLLVPLEGMHAYVSHVWIARGLRETVTPPFSKDLARGIGMEGMLRAIAIPLLGLAVPLLVWLSVFKPF